MDNEQKLYKELLKADGIDPDNVKNSERAVFREMLNREQKRMQFNKKLKGWSIIIRSKPTQLTAAAAVLAVILFINSFSGTSGGKVYAAIAKAMQNVNNVYISGWTTSLSPSFSTSTDTPRKKGKQYPAEQWEWFTADGSYRHYKKTGPITQWNDETRSYEYQQDYDRLWIDVLRSKIAPQTLTAKFQCMEARLDLLNQRGKVTQLGKRTIQGQQATGLRWQRGGKRKDIWLNENDLILESNRYHRVDGQWKQYCHYIFQYDQEIPDAICAYQVPEASKIIYSSQIDPRYEKWHNRLLQIAAYYQKNPLPESMELLSRPSDEPRWDMIEPSYAPGRIPGVTDNAGFWTIPMFWTLGDCILQWGGPDKIHLRIPEAARSIPMNHDLITSNDHTPMHRVEFVLNAMGYQLEQKTVSRTVWVARYDGRPLKSWQQVKAPVPNPDHLPLHPGMASGSGEPVTLKSLFDGFVFGQNGKLDAKGILIVDETGISSESAINKHRPEDVAVSSEYPFWDETPESNAMFKKWCQDEFGIMFEEELRSMKIWVVCEK